MSPRSDLSETNRAIERVVAEIARLRAKSADGKLDPRAVRAQLQQLQNKLAKLKATRSRLMIHRLIRTD